MNVFGEDVSVSLWRDVLHHVCVVGRYISHFNCTLRGQRSNFLRWCWRGLVSHKYYVQLPLLRAVFNVLLLLLRKEQSHNFNSIIFPLYVVFNLTCCNIYHRTRRKQKRVFSIFGYTDSLNNACLYSITFLTQNIYFTLLVTTRETFRHLWPKISLLSLFYGSFALVKACSYRPESSQMG